MKRKILSVFATVILLLVAAALSSCSGKVSEEEAISEVTRLVKESYELNVIYFGDGLPYEDDGDERNLYAPVAKDAPFVTKEALTYKTRTVFSNDYAASMIETAFQGAQDANGTTALYARYIGIYLSLHMRRNMNLHPPLRMPTHMLYMHFTQYIIVGGGLLR